MTKLKNKIFKIYVDFDGTITEQDVGEELFVRFGNEKKAYEIVRLWIDDKITSTQCWNRLCATVENLNESDLSEFIDGINIDPTFSGFVDYCRENDMEIKVLSDGLDIYIDKIMNRANQSDLPVFNNIGKLENGTLSASFPYTDEECKQCANCKRNHILSSSADTDFTVYIGDGYSDKCPAQYCDFIFAKHSLLKFCEQNRISYFPFNNFNDVIDRLNSLKERNMLKKRHQAELKRKDVYQQG